MSRDYTLAGIRRTLSDAEELLEQRASAKPLADLRKYYDRPADFMREQLQCTPWEAQVVMAELVRDHRRVVVVTANGVGKDWVTARIALWWVYARNGFVILTGPTERQVKHILMREVRRAFSAAKDLTGTLYTTELRVTEDADPEGEPGMLALTSDNADKLTGFHHPRLLVCMTEGQGVEEEAYEAAQACCTGPENHIFVYGNPTRPAGPFFNAAHSPLWKRLTVTALEHPNVVEDREVIAGATSRSFVNEIKGEYGGTSDTYRARVLSQFPTQSIDAITTRERMEAAFQRHETPTPESVAALSEAALIAWDVALRGDDLNAAAIVQGAFIREIHTWRAKVMEDSYAKIEELSDAALMHWSTLPQRRAMRKRVAMEKEPLRSPLVIDESGMGAPAVDAMRARGFEVTGFIGAAQPSSRYAVTGRYLNKRAEAYFAFGMALQKGTIALPRNAALLEEALATEWVVNAQDKVMIVSKDEVRRHIGRSPDTLDAVVMGFYESMHERMQGKWGTSRYYIGG